MIGSRTITTNRSGQSRGTRTPRCCRGNSIRVHLNTSPWLRCGDGRRGSHSGPCFMGTIFQNGAQLGGPVFVQCRISSLGGAVLADDISPRVGMSPEESRLMSCTAYR
ncbi:hypothetical protein CEXT_111181 [Caerostris extrusa]|uniref:Uncharacterized protein n=1 Tax=Caerostris extrusa TaxID=172846 RepID=A0AAV4MVR3_CAEEX|nr:hypothetical protein CEXT_111181 [Caerostris extrusa]